MARKISDDHASPLPIPAAPRRRRKPTIFDWLEESYNHAQGEMSLWIGVVTQAMIDALGKSRDPEVLYHKHEAIHWLSEGSKDFIMVCQCAGFDPDYVRRKAKRALACPMPWRAPAGKGERYLERKVYRENLRRRGTLETKSLYDDHRKVINSPWRPSS